jgi:hypothetical protein
MTRAPIKVKRKPITFFTERNVSNGGWYAFPKPEEEPPRYKLKKNQRILWCPWCGDWTIYKKIPHEDRHQCTGFCGFAHTDEWYVKTYNQIWFENIPANVISGMSIPAPARGRKGRKKK